ncbi:unnamed protein product [Phyllotreta striolata]|uniref:Uncharacterized protein n=1 Tax=Phyllotreta striolata TaxID=444603 RepID=A0A9N9TYJ2_PHYSR|nr:unnamed protein product [Phyllotreta striolata]
MATAAAISDAEESSLNILENSTRFSIFVRKKRIFRMYYSIFR